MIKTLLIANRGEIALRIRRSAEEAGIAPVVFPGSTPADFLDIAGIVAFAKSAGCDAIHPGYGFLSERADFAKACEEAGLVFIGPTPEQLARLGDKAAARDLAVQCGVPVLAGLPAPANAADIRAFMQARGLPVMIKALAGGGGRGIRLVRTAEEVDAALERCRSEAARAFGDDRVYAEVALLSARHIEVQILGDGRGGVMHLGERDCTLQRRNQKLIEIAPSPILDTAQRTRLCNAALAMAQAIGCRNAATFEFLVDREAKDFSFFFMEANPRLQVEHTITEELYGVDLVRAQLLVAGGATLKDLGLHRLRPGRGYALQARVNAERLMSDGTPVMAAGTIASFEVPSGPGIRVDSHGRRGYVLDSEFDSLLAKLIVRSHGDDLAALYAKARRALGDFRVEGVETNIGFLDALLGHAGAGKGATTGFVDDHRAELLALAGEGGEDAGLLPTLPEGEVAVVAPLTGTLVSMDVAPGARVRAGEAIAVIESMKMEHVVTAPVGGVARSVSARPGAQVVPGQVLVLIAADDEAGTAQSRSQAADPVVIRADLAEAMAANASILDGARPDAVAKRRAKGFLTARENVAALFDAGTFREYGGLVVAGQRQRRSLKELKERTPADGVVVGFGRVNGALFPPDMANTLGIVFDETVLAGTVGEMAREKMKRALTVAASARTPVILYAEGGGGRAGDTDLRISVTGWTMDVSTYYQLGRMSGLAPLVGVTNGRCFAANAGMLAICDVIIATEGSNIGVGGPTMIEGGRLGNYAPEEIGPSEVQAANGVIDILVKDEAEAAAVAKRYLTYFQGPVAAFEPPDARLARAVVPENRLRAYDVRKAILSIADVGSILELRPAFGIGINTSLIRVEGKPVGVIANNPLHLGGAIDTDAADKACRFMRLCEAFRIPLLFLCDTPGMMVGPEAEKTATVRRMGRMFTTGANLTVPFFTIVLRKAYGIGAELMAGGWFRAPNFVVSWPTGEFGGMNIEGNVRLAHAAELAGIADPAARKARFEELVAKMHQTGRALAVATHYEIDAVIDPADSRTWIASAIVGHQYRAAGGEKSVPYVDPW